MMRAKKLFSTTATTTKAIISETNVKANYVMRSELDGQNVALVCSGPKSPMVSSAYVFPAGPSQEAEGQKGASFLLRHSLFKTNRVFSKLSLTRELEMMGATLHVRSTRDGLIIGSRHPYNHAHELLDIIGCTVYEWNLSAHEYKQNVLPDAKVESVMNQNDPYKVLEDLAFGIAFRGSELAHPLYKSPGNGVEQEEATLKHFLEYCRTHGNHGLVSSGMEKNDLYYLQAEGVAFKGPKAKLPMPSVPARAKFHSGEERMEVEGLQKNYLLISLSLPAHPSIAKGMIVNRAVSLLLDPMPRIPFGSSNSFITGCQLPSNVYLKSFYSENSNGGLLGIILEAHNNIDLKDTAKTVLKYLQEAPIGKEHLFMAKERALLEHFSNWDSLEKRTEYLSRLILAGQYSNVHTDPITTGDISKAYEGIVKNAIQGKKLAVVAMGGGLEKLPYRDDL